MALGVSKVWGSAGTGAWGVWGSGGLLERKCEEMGRTKSAKERFWEHVKSFLGPFWKKRAEKESTGPKRAFRRFSEVPSTTKSTVFFRFWLAWGPSGEVTESGLEPIGVASVDPKDEKLIYKLTPHRRVLDIAAIWGPLFVLLGCSGTSFLSVLPR